MSCVKFYAIDSSAQTQEQSRNIAYFLHKKCQLLQLIGIDILFFDKYSSEINDKCQKHAKVKSKSNQCIKSDRHKDSKALKNKR